MSIVWEEREVSVSDLKPYERNPRTITKDAYDNLLRSLREDGYHQRVIATKDLRVVGGHQRIRALTDIGLKTVKVLIPDQELDDETFKRILVRDNLLFGSFDFEILANDFDREQLLDWGMPQKWFDIVDNPPIPEPAPEEVTGKGSLADRFGIAPFSVLNAREGWWQDRKRAWLAIGIKSELGRGDNLLNFSDMAKIGKKDYAKTYNTSDLIKQASGEVNRTTIEAGLLYGEMQNFDGAGREITGTSIFDPVLCEIAYRWFSPPGGRVLDPFSGGSVRGIVASKLGRDYTGVDLSKQQIEANLKQIIIADPAHPPVWVNADSTTLDQLAIADVDFVFSCPPYADLEVYSDDPKDLSAMAYEDFLKVYRAIIQKACAKLKQDRFACFVVGDVRDKKGMYRNFVGDTISAFLDAGMKLYNEAILVTAVGSLPLRVGKQFTSTRKLGKTHQNVLVFVKGDPKKATAAIGECEFGEIMPDGAAGSGSEIQPAEESTILPA